MICNNCGKEIDGSAKFCPECGFEITVENEPDDTKENINEVKTKKSGKGIILGIIGAIIVIALLAGIAFVHFFIKRIPNKKMHDAVINTLSDSVDEQNSIMPENYFAKLNTANSLVFDIRIDKGGKFGELTKLLFDNGVLEFDLANELSWLENAGAHMTSYHIENGSGDMSAVFKVNGTDIATAQNVFDLDGKSSYIRIPEISDKYLVAPITKEASSDTGMIAFLEDYSKGLNNIREYIYSGDTLTSFASRYVKCFTDNFKDIEAENHVLTVGEVSQSCVKYEVEVSEKTLNAILIDILEKAKTDKDVKKILSEAYPGFKTLMDTLIFFGRTSSFDDFYGDFIDSVDNAISELKEADDLTDDTVFTVVLFADDSDRLIGAELEMEDYYFTFGVYTAKEENEDALLIEILFGDGFYDAIRIKNNGITDGNKYSCSGAFEMYGADFLLFDYVNNDVSGYMDGKYDMYYEMRYSDYIAHILSNDNADVADFISRCALRVSSFGDINSSLDNRLDLLVDGELCAGLLYNGLYVIEDRDIIIPDSSLTVSVKSDEIDVLADWFKGCDLTVLKNNLKNAGAPAQITDLIEVR